MVPKYRNEILNICKNNFWKYSTLNKFLIIISIVLSATSIAYYICEFVVPTINGIVCCEIVGWKVISKICLLFVLYCILKLANIIFVSIGGYAICQEENWDNLDFAKAWVNTFKYIDSDENSENYKE